ncbi:MAG: restriction endonuclease subunit S [Terasakiella sp.]|uniref:restriction endonuclease subunit S n=1 Tax=unclassified Terasakiella TaxID=2614952 RepID=UPI003B002B2C
MTADFDFNTTHELGNIIDLISDKISADEVDENTYISTDNMIVDRGGVEKASKLPAASKFNHFQVGDTLFSNIRTYFRKVWHASFEGGASPDVLIFRSKDKKNVLPTFLYYLLSNKHFVDYTDQTSKGAKMPRGDKTAITQYRAYIPSPNVQRKIGDHLKALDDKIEINNQINRTLEEMAQAIFKSWFVDFEPTKAKIKVLEAGGTEDEAERAAMTAISGKDSAALDAMAADQPEAYAKLQATAALFPAALADSELGPIPEGWTTEAVINSAEFINGAAYKNMHFSSDPDAKPVIKIAELKSGITGNTKFTNTDLGDKFKLDTGDILFSWSGSPETSIDTFIWVGGEAWLNQHIFKVVNSEPAQRNSTFWLLKHLKPVFIAIAKNKQTTGLGHVTRKDMEKLKYCVPSEEIQALFCSVTAPYLDNIESNLVEQETLKSLRDTLLPKLLSGEIDLEGLADD